MKILRQQFELLIKLSRKSSEKAFKASFIMKVSKHAFLSELSNNPFS
jgi:hypothetical protein